SGTDSATASSQTRPAARAAASRGTRASSTTGTAASAPDTPGVADRAHPGDPRAVDEYDGSSRGRRGGLHRRGDGDDPQAGEHGQDDRHRPAPALVAGDLRGDHAATVHVATNTMIMAAPRATVGD